MIEVCRLAWPKYGGSRAERQRCYIVLALMMTLLDHCQEWTAIQRANAGNQ